MMSIVLLQGTRLGGPDTLGGPGTARRAGHGGAASPQWGTEPSVSGGPHGTNKGEDSLAGAVSQPCP